MADTQKLQLTWLKVTHGELCRTGTQSKDAEPRTSLTWHYQPIATTVPWTARRSNESILREISPEYSLEGLMLKLKLQYFGHLMWRADSFEKTLMLGKIEDRRRRGNRGWDGWMASPTQWTWVWVDSGSWWWTGRPGVLQSMGSQRVGHDWATELNWTTVWMAPKSETQLRWAELGYCLKERKNEGSQNTASEGDMLS